MKSVTTFIKRHCRPSEAFCWYTRTSPDEVINYLQGSASIPAPSFTEWLFRRHHPEQRVEIFKNSFRLTIIQQPNRLYVTGTISSYDTGTLFQGKLQGRDRWGFELAKVSAVVWVLVFLLQVVLYLAEASNNSPSIIGFLLFYLLLVSIIIADAKLAFSSDKTQLLSFAIQQFRAWRVVPPPSA